MHILKDLGGELRVVGDGSVSSEHDVKGHFFSVFGKMEIYIVRFNIVAH